jgi:glycogen operon protein
MPDGRGCIVEREVDHRERAMNHHPSNPSDAAKNEWERREGAPGPLGATWVPAERACNFALYSRHASGVTLLLYGPDDAGTPVATVRLDPLTRKSGRVWHCRVSEADLGGARYYAYRVEGPAEPGNRFDPAKVLLDPYARGVWFPPAFSRLAALGAGGNDGRAALGVLPAPRAAFDWGGDARPRHTSDAVIYEVHVRGFTRRASSGVSARNRGTFAGVVEKIPYLRDLGVTVVELLPVFQFDPQEGNYWGYMTLNFFSPHHIYAAADAPEAALDEFRGMVKALHAAGIEVVLDVVYNHTAEGGATGPTYSFRGIDNGTYYQLTPDLQFYRNDSGTGNDLRCSHPATRRLVMDSLRFWVREAHVDGFRFDLASIFTRNPDGSINTDDPPIIAEISADPELAGVRLIAEPWDGGAYLLGRDFPGITWAQWNGRYRDDVRGFTRSDPGHVPAAIARLYGSDDLFPDRLPDVYHPYQSINFLTCHDGFSLYDLVSYDRKHNEANGHGNTDGTDDNRSWNCGWEGHDGAPAGVLALRRRQVKNFCTLLFLANGTPMILAGDEFMNTQGGNNNPYNQDNETTWLDWSLTEENSDVLRFFREMIAFRKGHPSLCRSRYWREAVRWRGVGPEPDYSYGSRTLALYLDGAAEADDDIYVMANAYWEPLHFEIQHGSPGDWRRVVDTFLPSPQDIADRGSEPTVPGLAYTVEPRSVVVLKRDRR